jgi:hypothetical protein
MNTDSSSRYDDARKQVVEVSRALLERRESVLTAACKIASLRYYLDPDQVDPDLLAFAGIESQEDHLLVFDSLRGWHPDVQESKAEEIAEAERFHMPGAFDSARRLIERYG